jgi:hypothetical protein
VAVVVDDDEVLPAWDRALIESADPYTYKWEKRKDSFLKSELKRRHEEERRRLLKEHEIEKFHSDYYYDDYEFPPELGWEPVPDTPGTFFRRDDWTVHARPGWKESEVEEDFTTTLGVKIREGGIVFVSPPPRSDSTKPEYVENNWTIDRDYFEILSPLSDGALSSDALVVENHNGALRCAACVDSAWCNHVRDSIKEKSDVQILENVHHYGRGNLDGWYLCVPILPEYDIFCMVSLLKANLWDESYNQVYTVNLLSPCDATGRMHRSFLPDNREAPYTDSTPEWFNPESALLFFPQEGRFGLRESIVEYIRSIAPYESNIGVERKGLVACKSPAHNLRAQDRLHNDFREGKSLDFTESKSLVKFIHEWCFYWFDMCLHCASKMFEAAKTEFSKWTDEEDEDW